MLAQGRDGPGNTAYERHHPEQTLLYQLVEAHFPALVEQLAQHDCMDAGGRAKQEPEPRANPCPTMSTENSRPTSSAVVWNTVSCGCAATNATLSAWWRCQKEQELPTQPLLLPRAWCHAPEPRRARCLFSRGRARGSRTRFFIDQAAGTPTDWYRFLWATAWKRPQKICKWTHASEISAHPAAIERSIPAEQRDSGKEFFHYMPFVLLILCLA